MLVDSGHVIVDFLKVNFVQNKNKSLGSHKLLGCNEQGLKIRLIVAGLTSLELILIFEEVVLFLDEIVNENNQIRSENFLEIFLKLFKIRLDEKYIQVSVLRTLQLQMVICLLFEVRKRDFALQNFMKESQLSCSRVSYYRNAQMAHYKLN